MQEYKMQKSLSILVLVAAVLLTVAGCAQTGRSVRKSDGVVAETIQMSSSFDEVRGKVWILEELVSESGSATIINRRKLEADGMGDAFTLIVDAERISGKGAPNRYFSPYTLGPDQEISISPIAGTLMMGIVEPEDIQEREYYNYLEQVNQWFLTGNKLELYSETPEGEPVILVFTSKEQ
jgi:heat shock protein HslJ